VTDPTGLYPNLHDLHDFQRIGGLDPSVLQLLQQQELRQRQKLLQEQAELVTRQEVTPPREPTWLTHSLLDYRAVCVASEGSLVGITSQSGGRQATPLPANIALWEVKIGELLQCAALLSSAVFALLAQLYTSL